jgi:hypothetical protein
LGVVGLRAGCDGATVAIDTYPNEGGPTMEGGASKKKFTQESAKVPKDPRALRRLERLIDLGELEELPGLALASVPRYLVTFMKSETAGRIRSATIVSVTNQSRRPNVVTVTYFKGFVDNTSPSGSSTFVIPPDFTVDFASRDLPSELTVVNSVPNPQLTFDEGRAIVSSRQPEIGVSARVYYTSGERDEELLSITDSGVVVFGAGNHGD